MPNFFSNLFSGHENQPTTKDVQNHSVEELDKAIRKSVLIDDLSDSRSRKTDKLAVSTVTPAFIQDRDGNTESLSIWINRSFKQMIGFNLNNNKHQRIKDYQDLATEEVIGGAIHEIATSCLASTYEDTPISVRLDGDYSDEVKEIVNKELKRVVEFFKLEMKGQKYFEDFIIEGELAFENVFSIQKPELGILDVKSIPAENIDPIFRNFKNEEIEAFWLRKPNNLELYTPSDVLNKQRQKQQAVASFDNLPMARSQVTYCNSGMWDSENQFVIPMIMKGQKSQKKLSLIEDAVVINAVVTAPERLLWNIPVGNMSGPEKERYMQNVMNAHKKNKGLQGNGDITERLNPMGMTEDFYVPVAADGTAASVQRVAGSAAFGSNFNGTLNYFHQKVYEAMGVPIARLNPETSQSDGSTITMQELAFAERIESIQKRFAQAIKQTLITHLKMKGLKLHNESCKNNLILESKKNGKPINPEILASPEKLFEEHVKLVENNYHYGVFASQLCSKGKTEKEIEKILGRSYWNQYELKEVDIKVKFNLPTNFLALREQQMRSIKQENFNALVSNEHFSFWWLAKRELGLSDTDILANQQWKKREAAYFWELSKIEEMGPDFRRVAAEEAGLTGGGRESFDGGGSALPSNLGGVGGEVADFGDDDGALDEMGGGEVPTDTPTEAPAPKNDAGDGNIGPKEPEEDEEV